MAFFKPQYGNGVKKPPLLGSYTHSEKKLYAHKMGEGGPPILPLGGRAKIEPK